MAVSNERWGPTLLVGGNGRLGYFIAQALLQQPHCGSVHSLGRSNKIAHPCDGVQYHQADLRDAASLSTALHQIRPETIINVAAPPHTDTLTPRHVFDEVFVQGQDTLLRIAREVGTKYVICTTSINVIDGFEHNKDPEHRPYWPENSAAFPYWVERARGEKRLLAADSPSLQTLSIRLPLIIGERDNAFVPSLLQTLAEGGTDVQVGGDTALMDVVSGEDAARAHVLALQALMKLGNDVHGEAFNIIGNYPLSFWTMARIVWTEAGWKQQKAPMIIPAWIAWWIAFISDLMCKPFGTEAKLSRHVWRFMCNSWTYDDSKARMKLRFTPECDTTDELRKSVRWHLKNNK